MGTQEKLVVLITGEWNILQARCARIMQGAKTLFLTLRRGRKPQGDKVETWKNNVTRATLETNIRESLKWKHREMSTLVCLPRASLSESVKLW